MSDLDDLKKIIPPDQAVANKALSRSLQQVKKIFDSTLPELAPVVAGLETNVGLNLIANLTTAVPNAAVSFYNQNIATGSGPGNTLVLTDLVGIASGVSVNTDLPIVTSAVANLANIGALNPLTANGGTPTSSINGAYTVMSYLLANAYTTVEEAGFTITIPPPLPGAGIYGPAGNIRVVNSQAMNGVIAAANASITSIATTYGNVANVANQATLSIANEMAKEQNNRTKAGINLNELQPNVLSPIMNIVTSLHDLGLDVDRGGAAEFLEGVANLNSLSGQAVVSSMREGRNIALLNSVGIVLDTQIPAIPPVAPRANLLPGQLNAAEVVGNITT